MSEIDQTQLDDVLSVFTSSGRTALLPALWEVQNLYGYIPQDVARDVAELLNVPLADVYGVIDFYTLLYDKPVGKVVIHVCNDPVCALASSDSVLKQTWGHVEKQEGRSETYTIERAPCLGLCVHAPAALVKGAPVAHADTRTWEELLASTPEAPETYVGGDLNILTANCRTPGPTWLEAYEHSGGYQALRKALLMDPFGIIDLVKESGLVGRGGAAFPTGVKWEAAAKADASADGRSARGERYVVCNGDEAEPGTFKDRVMMEKDPHRILEGMIITGRAIGASKGYFYIRGEYQNAYETVVQAVDEALSAGYLGEDILGSGFTFNIEVRRGAGAYICGEETALFESIEGKRGLARVKPPFPVTHGLFGQPTVINNVETLCNVPFLLGSGIDSYRSIGTQKSTGPKLFCLSGDVEKPGIYEVPMNITFRHLLYDLAGGVRDGRKLQSALFGGAAGAFATQKDLDVQLSFEGLREAGLPLGAGVITVFDERRDMLDVLSRLAHFFDDESCGKCFPCQMGTKRQHEIIHRIADGNALPGDVDRLKDLAEAMVDSSLCGLGQTASSAVMSALKLWPHLFKPR